MTDDNARYRSSDPFASTPDQGGHGNDPLAELARLIGQNGPFADLARGEQQHDAPPPRAPQPYDDPPPQDEHRSDRHADRYSGEQPTYDPQHRRDQSYDPRYDAPYPADPAPQFAEPAPRAHESAQVPAPEVDWHRQPPFDPFAPASSRGGEPSHGDYSRDEAPPRPTSASEFSFPSLHAQPARYFNSPSYDPPSFSPSSEAFAAPSHHEPAGMPASPLPFASDRAASSQPSPPLDEYYDDAPQGGRRKGLITVAAVFMLAVFGTAGAFGYRTWVGSPSVKPAPAVIRASAEPAKVAPPTPAVDPNANKISYDRFADRGQNEKVVVREEKPVDIREATRTGSAMTAVPVPKSAGACHRGERRHAVERADRSQEGAHRDDPSGCAGHVRGASADGDAAGACRADAASRRRARAIQRAARSRQSGIAAAAGSGLGRASHATATCGSSGAGSDGGQRAAVARARKCPAAATGHTRRRTNTRGRGARG